MCGTLLGEDSWRNLFNGEHCSKIDFEVLISDNHISKTGLYIVMCLLYQYINIGFFLIN